MRSLLLLLFAAAAEGEDLKQCVSSPEPGRAPWIEQASASSAIEPAPIVEPVLTPEPTSKPVPQEPAAVPVRSVALDKARLEELDSLLDRPFP